MFKVVGSGKRFASSSSSSLLFQIRTFSSSKTLSATHAHSGHGHHHHHKPAVESLLQSLQKRLPSFSAQQVSSRLSQLKNNHMRILSSEINWNVLKPEEREEQLREIQDLIATGYSTLSADKQKSIAMANVYNVDTSDIKNWDLYLSKNDALQAGDWRDMSLDEKKAAYWIAWGPVEETDTAFRMKVLFAVIGFVGLSYGIYAGLFNYFRSKKNLPNLSEEWIKATEERMIRERMEPYTGASAKLFTKDGIKEA